MNGVQEVKSVCGGVHVEEDKGAWRELWGVLYDVEWVTGQCGRRWIMVGVGLIMTRYRRVATLSCWQWESLTTLEQGHQVIKASGRIETKRLVQCLAPSKHILHYNVNFMMMMMIPWLQASLAAVCRMGRGGHDYWRGFGQLTVVAKRKIERYSREQ